MTLTILGATGKTGVHLLARALDAGHQVRALVRDPAKVPRQHERLTLVHGNVRDAAAVARAVEGSDAVLSALGPTRNAPDMDVSTGVAHVLAAMETHDVQRLVFVTGAGVRVDGDRPGVFDRVMGLALRLFAKHVLADSQRAVARIHASDREWTVVRVPMLTDGPATGTLRVGMVGQGIGSRLTRADLAEFLLAQVDDRSHVHASPALSN
ncbi:MAG: NAD(P)H-binding protein [Trueperaceae bacterium]